MDTQCITHDVCRGSQESADMPFLHPCSLRTDSLADLFVFDPTTLTWTELTGSIKGEPPSARMNHAFASAGGRLYIHGGYNIGNGESCN
jgi:hypothetical protein